MTHPYRTTIEVRHEARNIDSAKAKGDQIIAAIDRNPGCSVQYVHTVGLESAERHEDRRAA